MATCDPDRRSQAELEDAGILRKHGFMESFTYSGHQFNQIYASGGNSDSFNSSFLLGMWGKSVGKSPNIHFFSDGGVDPPPTMRVKVGGRSLLALERNTMHPRASGASCAEGPHRQDMRNDSRQIKVGLNDKSLPVLRRFFGGKKSMNGHFCDAL